MLFKARNPHRIFFCFGLVFCFTARFLPSFISD